MRRYLSDSVWEDLARKMVFLSGPRQVGKTTVALDLLERIEPADRVYLNWDRPEHRAIVRNLGWSRNAPVAVLDEVHKFARWKSLLKGFHDTEGGRQRLLVTGSARLDLYRKGGDSMAGRYSRARLHPLSIGELKRDGGPPEARTLLAPHDWASQPAGIPIETEEALQRLGGFPEPFLGASERAAKRWRLLRHEQILRQDLRDLTRLREVSLVEQLVDLLVERVASTLSANALREDLEVEHKTILHWLEVLERLFVVFRLRPHGGPLARTLKRAPKLYFWDWSAVTDPGARFENMVACHLLKYQHWLEDSEGARVELRYVRDRERREVDFLLLKDRRPWVLIEARLTASQRSPALDYFATRLSVPHSFQVVSTRDSGHDVVPAARLFAGLP